jgi:hypothetical protein
MTQLIEEFAKLAYQNHDLAHGFPHAERVYHNALAIIDGAHLQMTAQEQLELPYVMYGHDFRDHKLVSEGTCLPEQVIQDFYKGQLGEVSANKIKHIHENCSWSQRKRATPLPDGDWMRLVLQDADWLEALGEEGLTRCIQYTQFVGGHVPEDVCRHIHEKLLLIPQNFNYQTTRDLVKQRDLITPLLVYLNTYETTC